MKEIYITPEMEILQFDSEDVITESVFNPGAYKPGENERMPY